MSSLQKKQNLSEPVEISDQFTVPEIMDDLQFIIKSN